MKQSKFIVTIVEDSEEAIEVCELFLKHVCAILTLLFASILAVVLLYLILDSILGL